MQIIAKKSHKTFVDVFRHTEDLPVSRHGYVKEETPTKKPQLYFACCIHTISG